MTMGCFAEGHSGPGRRGRFEGPPTVTVVCPDQERSAPLARPDHAGATAGGAGRWALFAAWGDGPGLQRHPFRFFVSRLALGRTAGETPELGAVTESTWPQPEAPMVLIQAPFRRRMEAPYEALRGPGAVSSACFQVRHSRRPPP